jgi:alpha-amylase
MPDICLYFQVHQPNRLLPRDTIAPGGSLACIDEAMDATVLSHVSEKCYLPANRMFKRLIEKHEGRFSMALSISGTLIEQMERHRPDVLESFRDLVAAGNVELLAETYYHSLAFLHSNKEFERQVDLHLEKLEEIFHVRPRVFSNTELIYSDAIAAKAETMGFDGILAEGVERNLKGKSPNFLYSAPETARIKTLLRNSWLSDDLGFRFSNPKWPDHPLTTEKYAAWLADSPGDIVNLFMGYETIGEHQGKETGIFEFWEALPDAVQEAGLQWVTPSEVVELYRASREYSCRFLTSWTDGERDLSAWMNNDLQREALARVQALEKDIIAANDPDLTHAWANMQTANHFHWMSTKGGADGAEHSPLIPYPSPREAHDRFMHVLDDLQALLAKCRSRAVCA